MKATWTALLLALVACQAGDEQAMQETDSTAVAASELAAESTRFENATALGDTLTLQALTQVSDILARPEQYVGQRVLVKGQVVGVCLEKGCWMDIVTAEGADTIQIKVDDGVIVFPPDAVGKRVLAEGTVEKLELTKEQAIEAAKHRAEETKSTFDPAVITGPVTKYRIRGTGVQIAP